MDQNQKISELENKALSFCTKQAGKYYRYQGKTALMQGKVGTFEIWHDENCCGASQNILIAFVTDEAFYLLGPKEWESWLKDCIAIKED